MNPYLTVIIPVYNSEGYLRQCLDSVFRQTLLEHTEIICINDGSTDTSMEILLQYQKKYGHMVLISIANQGAGRARNYGLRAAGGRYVCFMDSDDYYPDDMVLETLYRAANSHGAKICGGSMSMEIDGKVVRDYRKGDVEYRFQEEGFQAYSDFQMDFWYTKYIYDRDMLVSNRIFFPDYTRFQDPPFFVRAMICAEKFYAIKEITYCCRRNYKMGRFSERQTLDALTGMLDILQISRKHSYGRLHLSALNRVYDMMGIISRYLQGGNRDFLPLLKKVDDAIDYHLLENGKKQLSFEFRPFTELALQLPEQEKLLEQKAEFLENLQSCAGVIIYGAGCVGQLMMELLSEDESLCVLGFAVSDAKENASSIGRYPVRNIEEFIEWRDTGCVLVATLGNSQGEIVQKLKKMEFHNVVQTDYLKLQQFVYCTV